MLFNYKNIVLLLLLIALFFLSYIRDTSFILINASIDHEQFNYANTAIPGFLKQLTIPELKKLKWVLAIGCAALFMTITTASIHFYFRNKQYTQLTVILYLALGCSALLAEFINHLFKLPTRFFNILHIPETIIESPLVLLLLFSGLFFMGSRQAN